MENSTNSISNLTITSSSREKREDNNSSLEESGWTFYIQSSLSSSSCYEVGDSVLSDAASSAVKIFNYQNGGLNVNHERSKRNTKKMTFSKGKVLIQGEAIDDDLEDTASSPVNSPKVFYMKDYEMKQKEMSSAYLEVERKSSTSRNDVEGDGGDITDLKKRGLCLVPLSNVAKYFSY